ncbi:MAG: glycoside hydrolase family 2 protein, partial [Bacteroidales bacterium]|nr:glycoside hydrolase family 2 protein [Bacteroidales bacterium]
WKDIQILAWNDARIEDVFIEQDYVGKDSARISARVEIESSVFAEAAIEIEVKGKPNRKAKQKINLIPGGNIARISFSMPDPQRWWPNGMGDPYLYDYMVKLHLKEILLDENSGRIGLRDIRVVNAPDSIGESFYVEVNGQQLFIQGANYIPQDNFLTRVRNQDYKKLIKDAAQSNMNMLRVWGGGVYEKDIFYDLCDEYGLLVWQDFMFACNMYPGNKEFLVSIEKEAEQNVKRLRNHACIALWCGNNEVDEGWKNWGWQKQLGYSFADSIIVRQAYHDIFDSILPAVIHQYDPATFYWPSSPEYGWGHEESMTHGDSHYWGVWWGVEPFETYREKVPRFMSEFGFQAFPSLAAIDSFAEPKNQHLDSKAMKTHQKHPRGFELIDLYMQRDFPIPGDFNAYVYMSQLLQAHGIGMAIEAQRQAKPRCMGSLYWQFNDCWPVISWSSRDYYGNWKALQYRVQDLYKNVVLIAGSTEDEIELSVLNDSQEKLQVTIHMRIQDFGEKIYFDSLFKCTVESLGKTAFIFIRDCIMPTRGECKLVLITELRDKKGRMLDSDFHYFCKPGQLFLEPVQFKTEIKKIREGYLIRLEGNHLAKCVFLQFEGHTGHFTKNFFDLPAGHNYTTRYLTEERINDPKENLKIICLNEFVNGKPLGRKRVHLNKY